MKDQKRLSNLSDRGKRMTMSAMENRQNAIKLIRPCFLSYIPR